MRLESTLIALAAVLLVCIGAVGCGSGSESEGYEEILHGLKRAAVSKQSYDAVRRAENLKPTFRASLDAFCETNREMVENREAWKVAQTGYYLVRIKLRAERELPFVSTHPVAVAVKEYKDLFGLDSFDPAEVRRYGRACYS
jgi:hypothetical protein